ncbi:hypothetical protein DL93DRAFT_1424869 [Clavulina sp. PMI_390]|nr:hypothetical protein DL93DRAFT_1424869 [Clavulina sp. PMI_390]
MLLARRPFSLFPLPSYPIPPDSGSLSGTCSQISNNDSPPQFSFHAMSLEFDDMPGMGMGVMSKDLSVGALLVCEIASAILFGVLTVQCGIYFDRYKQDKKGLRTLVYTIWFLEFLHQMFSAWWTYQIGIQEFGNMMFMMKSGWRVGAESAAMTLTALIVQLFYARRGYLLNRSLWPISLLVTILAFVAFGAGMAASIEMITLPYFGDFMYYMWLQEIWFSSEAATDLLVALIVVYSLGAVKKSGYSSTESGLWRLIMYTISNGVLTSILAFAVIALFKLLPNTLTHPGVAFLLSRVYSNSLLAS